MVSLHDPCRCTEAERQLAQSRDLEGGGGFGGDDAFEEEESAGSATGAGVRRKIDVF